MGAADATLTEALDLLRNDQASVVRGVLEGEYAFWIGSGISRERFPGLYGLLLSLLNQLYVQVDHSDLNCPYRRTLQTIIQMTTVNGIDLQTPPENWPQLEDLIRQLLDRYADVLDQEIRIDGTAISLYWDILELHKLYGNPAIVPDAEHRFLALLVEEGIVSQLVTTNWDALIELAHQVCRPGRPLGIKIVACNEELEGGGNGTTANLFKIHGCARKVLQDTDHYGHYLVVTRSHINKWSIDDLRRPFREAMGTLLRQYPALFIGLSGQDYNLQAICVSASLGREHFPVEPPRVLFTVEQITYHQQAILRAIYDDEPYRNNAANIDEGATLPLYAKPLLGSLYVFTILEKLNLIFLRGAGNFQDFCRNIVQNGITWLEGFLRNRYDVIENPDERWRQLAREVPSFVERFLSLYRSQQSPTNDEEYQGLCNLNLARMEADANFPQLSLHWVLLALSLFQKAAELLNWTLEEPYGQGGEHGQLVVDRGTSPIRIFFLDDSTMALPRLAQAGFVDMADPIDVAIVYPHGHKPFRRTTTPHRSLPSRPSPHGDPVELWLRDLHDDASTEDELIELLRMELLAVRTV